MGRRRLFRLGLALAAAVAPGIVLRSARADATRELMNDLVSASSYKVRLQAAVLLARLKDPRAAQALGRAAVADPHRSVRITAIRLLGRNPGGDIMSAQQARMAISRALADKDPQVRRHAAAALATLRRRTASSSGQPPAPRGPAVVAVGHMGDRTGRAPKEMRERMRAELRSLLTGERKLVLAETSAPGITFLVDGTIARLQLATGPEDVEVTCAVELVVSRPPRGIVTVASGEAVVQKPRAHFRPQMRPFLEREALEHAVRGAYENLARFLAAQ